MQCLPKQNKTALTFWKVGHSCRTTQGLLSQTNHSGPASPASPAPQTSTRAFHGQRHFLLTTKPQDRNSPGGKNTWGFSNGTQRREGESSALWPQGRTRGWNESLRPPLRLFHCMSVPSAPALRLSQTYRRSRKASGGPTNSRWVSADMVRGKCSPSVRGSKILALVPVLTCKIKALGEISLSSASILPSNGIVLEKLESK